MSKKASIIVLWVVGIIAVLIFGYVSIEYGLLPTLKTTTPKEEGDALSIWTICLFAAFCALGGGIGTIAALYYLDLLRDALGQQLKPDNQTLITEVLNLKNHIRVIYSIVPVVFIFLSLFGIQGYNELNKIRGVAAVKEAEKEWPNIKTKWDSIDNTVSAKANRNYVDTTFFTKESAKANRNYVDTTFLKTSELETMITQLKSDKLRAWIKADSVHIFL